MRKKSYPIRFAIPGIVLFLVFIIVPFLVSVYYSFTNWNFQKADFIGWDNYIEIMTDKNMNIAFKNTFIFTIVTTIGKVVFGMLLAVFLNRVSKVVRILRTVFYLPAVINSIAVGIVFKSIFHPGKGILNNALAVIGLGSLGQNWLTDTNIAMYSICGVEIWKWTGYTMMILLAGMQNISQDYYEAAIIDGATGWQCFRRITLPLLVPSINNVVIFSLIGGLKVFDIVVTLTNGGPGYATQVFNTIIYHSYSYQLYGQATAGTTILSLIVLVITLLAYNIISSKEVDMA